MCARSYSPRAIPLLNVYDTDNIRAIGQVPRRVWRITQIVDEHIEKTRQKAGEGSRREARRTKATSRRADPYRGPETGQRTKEATEEGQGRVETGSGSPTHTGKAGVEREDEGVNPRCLCLGVFLSFEALPSFTFWHDYHAICSRCTLFSWGLIHWATCMGHLQLQVGAMNTWETQLAATRSAPSLPLPDTSSVPWSPEFHSTLLIFPNVHPATAIHITR